MTIRLRYLLLFVCAAGHLLAQQVADTAFNPVISNPRYPVGKGSIVTVDAAHNNFHTLDNRYAPFGKVLSSDGYRLQSNSQTITVPILQGCRIYVISNPLDSSNIGRWQVPTPSAFSQAEISAIHDWVLQGGRLLLIADHMPFAGAALALAQSFGFRFLNCFALDNRNRNFERFYKGNGSLAENDLTRDVDTVVTFTGSAFKMPAAAKSLLTLKNYTLSLPAVAWQFEENTPTLPGEGFSQGAYMEYGKGKIVVMGEAAMFSAQLAGGGRNPVGMNCPEAGGNVRLLINLIHWLDQ
jgi:hypothetical protein